jgi:hypothetical protein
MKEMHLAETTPIVTNTDNQILLTEETDSDELTEWLKHGDLEGWLRLTTKQVILEEIISTTQSHSSARGKCWMSWLLLMFIANRFQG